MCYAAREGSRSRPMTTLQVEPLLEFVVVFGHWILQWGKQRGGRHPWRPPLETFIRKRPPIQRRPRMRDHRGEVSSPRSSATAMTAVIATMPNPLRFRPLSGSRIDSDRQRLAVLRGIRSYDSGIDRRGTWIWESCVAAASTTRKGMTRRADRGQPPAPCRRQDYRRLARSI